MNRTVFLSMAFVVMVTAAVWSIAESSKVQAARSSSQSQSQSLLGESYKSVLTRYGAPAQINFDSSTMTWSYHDKKATNPAVEILIHEGIVVGETIPKEWKGERITTPKGTPYLGQTAADLARLVGSPKSKTSGALATRLYYAGGQEVVLKFGFVCGYSKN